MTIGFFIAVLGLGGCVGFAAGLLGIGCGMMLVPFLNYMLPRIGIPQDLAVHAAIATAMGTIVFTSLSSMRAHQKHRAIHWDVVKLMVPGRSEERRVGEVCGARGSRRWRRRV